MNSSTVLKLFLASSALAVGVAISEDLPLSTITIPIPTPELASTNPTEATTSTSSTPTNCWIDGPCDCDEDDPDYFQCITNPNCRECFINDRTLTPLTSTQPDSAAQSSSMSSSTSSDGLPDNCWIGGPCDCSVLEDYSDPWYQCIDNPACRQCHVGDATLTPRSSTVSIPSSSSTSSGASAEATTNFETMPPGTYTVTSSGTVVIIFVTDEVADPTGLPVSTVGKGVSTRTTVVV